MDPKKPIELVDLSREQKALLLFLETQAVDHGGRIFCASMNKDDWDIFHNWVADGFIEGGRIKTAFGFTKERHQWVRLSDNAWRLAHEERKLRAARMAEKNPTHQET